MFVGSFTDETKPTASLPPSFPTRLIFNRMVVSPYPLWFKVGPKSEPLVRRFT